MSHTHTRTVSIDYDFGFSASEKQLLHHVLGQHNLADLDTWDTELPEYGVKEETTSSDTYLVNFVVDDTEVQLTFDYRYKAQDVVDQFEIMKVETKPIEKVTTTITKEVEADWRGSTILYTESDFHLGSYSDKYQIISYNDEGEADVRMKIDFTAYSHRSTLKFTVEWDTDRVQKDAILQEKLVDLPTPLMGKIQAIFESIFESETFDKTLEEPTISCMFDVRSHHSSEGKPAVIDMLREAQRQASSEEEVLDLIPSNVFERSESCFLINSGFFKR